MLLPEPPKLSDYPVSSSSLLDWLRPRIDDSMLEEIAAADYENDFDEHLEALQKIRNTGLVPSPLRWFPKEALNLVSHSEPDDPNWKPRPTGKRGHLMRAFCCAALLESVVDDESSQYIDTEITAVVQLTASVLILGREASAAALSSLWRRLSIYANEEEEHLFFAFAILLLCASKYELVNSEQIRKIAAWMIQQEAEYRKKRTDGLFDVGNQWLLGLTYHDQNHDTWRKLTREILLETPRENKETAAVLRDIGRRIVDGSAVNETE